MVPKSYDISLSYFLTPYIPSIERTRERLDGHTDLGDQNHEIYRSSDFQTLQSRSKAIDTGTLPLLYLFRFLDDLNISDLESFMAIHKRHYIVSFVVLLLCPNDM